MSNTTKNTGPFRLLDLPFELQDTIYTNSSLGRRHRARLLRVNKEVHSRTSDIFKDRTYIKVGYRDGGDRTSQTAIGSCEDAQEINVRLIDDPKSIKRLRQKDSILAQYTASNSKLQRINIEVLFGGRLDVQQITDDVDLPLSTLNIPDFLTNIPTMQVLTEYSRPGPRHVYLVSIPGDEDGERPTEHYIGASGQSFPFTDLAQCAGTLLDQSLAANSGARIVWVDVASTDWWSSRDLNDFTDISEEPERMAFSYAHLKAGTLPRGSSRDYTRGHLRCISLSEFEEMEAGQLLHNYLQRETKYVPGRGRY